MFHCTVHQTYASLYYTSDIENGYYYQISLQKKLILFCKLLRFLRSKSSPRTTKKKKKEKKEKKEGPFQRWTHPDWRNGGSRERTTTTPTTPTYRRKCPAFLFFLPKKKNKNKAEYSTSNATSGGHSLKNRDFWLSKENTNRRTDALSY